MNNKYEKYEEAIENIKKKFEKADTTLLIAIESIRKQIPTVVVDETNWGENHCPECNAYLNRRARYCWYCGKKLEWKEYLMESDEEAMEENDQYRKSDETR